jgi:hypothetical protein
LTSSDWLALVQKTGIGFPADVPGADDAHKAANYALTLERTIETAFPTAVVAARLTKNNAPADKDLIAFFNNNSGFDLGRDHVDVYLAANPNSLQGASDPKALTQRLKGVQRAFTLTPRYEEMSVLLADGIDSAQRLTAMSGDQFAAKYAANLGADRVQAIYARASQIAAAALLLYGKYSSRFALPTTVTER